MWYVILPGIDPAMRLVNGVGFFVSHLVYGLSLGVGVAWVRAGARAGRLAAVTPLRLGGPER